MPGPISPKDVVSKKCELIPEPVFEAFNELIAKYWDGHSAVVPQKEVAGLIAHKLDTTTTQVFDRHLLDIEDAYKGVGWSVTYDKPAYNETYEATFEFKRK